MLARYDGHMAGWRLEHTYAELPQLFYSHAAPTAVRDPRLAAFNRGGREVARASKKWVSLSDTYSIDIDEREDDVLILASAVVIDLVLHPDEKDEKKD
jgi:hypothetical protein